MHRRALAAAVVVAQPVLVPQDSLSKVVAREGQKKVRKSHARVVSCSVKFYMYVNLFGTRIMVSGSQAIRQSVVEGTNWKWKGRKEQWRKFCVLFEGIC